VNKSRVGTLIFASLLPPLPHCPDTDPTLTQRRPAPADQDDGSTKLVLDQTGVPEDERERTEKGWRSMLFDPMNSMLGGRVIGA
jgi:hypothetical protein